MNVRQGDDRILSWGFWGFCGEELARCLYEWKRAAPDAFSGYCVRFGLDVADGANEDEASSDAAPPSLTVRSEGRSTRGRAAEWAIVRAAPVAVLARAGRDGARRRRSSTWRWRTG